MKGKVIWTRSNGTVLCQTSPLSAGLVLLHRLSRTFCKPLPGKVAKFQFIGPHRTDWCTQTIGSSRNNHQVGSPYRHSTLQVCSSCVLQFRPLCWRWTARFSGWIAYWWFPTRGNLSYCVMDVTQVPSPVKSSDPTEILADGEAIEERKILAKKINTLVSFEVWLWNTIDSKDLF